MSATGTDSETNGKIVDAYVEWDDPRAFRVYLIREVTRNDGDGPCLDLDDGTPMESVMTGDGVEARLYRAAFLHATKDVARLDACDRVLGWATEAPAKRVAKAVKVELARIEKGEPAPSIEAIQIAIASLPKRKPARR